MDDTVRRALYWAWRLERAARDMEGCQPVFDAYADRFLEAAAQLREYETAAQKGWDEMSRVDVTFRKLGAVRGEENGDSKAAAKAVWDKCKAAVKKLSAPYQTAESELLDDLRAIAPAMEALLELTADFDRRFYRCVRRGVVRPDGLGGHLLREQQGFVRQRFHGLLQQTGGAKPFRRIRRQDALAFETFSFGCHVRLSCGERVFVPFTQYRRKKAPRLQVE